MMRRWRWVAGLAIAALASVWLAGCSAGSRSGSADSANATTMDYGEAMPESAESPAEENTAQQGGAVETESPASAENEMPPTADSGSGGVAVTPEKQPSQTNRMLIYTANLTMEVEHYADAYTDIQNSIHLSGGYIVSFIEETTQYEKTGSFTIKVPAGGFNGFLAKIEEIPNLKLNRSLKAQDVSEEYVDLEARLRAKQVVEKRLLGFMEKASRTDELVTFSNELARVQEEIERMKGRMRYLEQNVAYSTVELRLYEKLDGNNALGTGSGAPTLSERMGLAVQGSLNVLVTVLEGVLVVAAGTIPIAAAAGIVGVPVYWLWKRRSGTKRNESSPTQDR